MIRKLYFETNLNVQYFLCIILKEHFLADGKKIFEEFVYVHRYFAFIRSCSLISLVALIVEDLVWTSGKTKNTF